jgi:Zn-finger nucleic acid-binding protein
MDDSIKCPVDGATLVISDRSGVEIDYCPECRGVWLDRGELDKVIDRTVGEAPPPSGRRDERDNRDNRTEYRPKKKRDSFLSELFDF